MLSNTQRGFDVHAAIEFEYMKQNMTNKMPERFDIIYAHGINDKDKEDYIGYVMNVGENKKVQTRADLPSYAPRWFTIKFLNKQAEIFEEKIVFNYISTGKWKSVVPNIPPILDKPRYEAGDLIFNTKTKKVSLINNVVDANENQENKLDMQTQTHSRYWYKIQSPGQQQEPLSETFIEHGIENNFIQIHKKK
jgi:hypothetical protein